MNFKLDVGKNPILEPKTLVIDEIFMIYMYMYTNLTIQKLVYNGRIGKL